MDGSGGIPLRASSEYRKFPQIRDKIIGQDDTAPAELANGNAAQLRVAIKRASLDRQHARGFGNAVGEPSRNLRHSGASLLRVARRRHSQHDDASGSENSADKAEKGQELPGANYRPREAHKMRHFLRGSAINSRTVLSSDVGARQRHRPCPRAAASSTTEAGLPLTIADNARDHRSSASRFSLS